MKTNCPNCRDTRIYGRNNEWWCGNSDCAVKWGSEDE